MTSAVVPSILTTFPDVDWPHTDHLPPPRDARRPLTAARAIVARARHYDLVLLNGSVSFSEGYDEILVAGLIARTTPRPCVVLEGCYWEEGTRFLDRFLSSDRAEALAHDPPARHGRRLAHALVDWVRRPSVHYVVFSSDERHTFAHRWSVPESRVAAMTYHGNSWPERAEPDPGEGGYVFAGGNSLRDYRPLLTAAPDLGAEIVIATTLPMGPVPASVRARGSTENEYRELARGAAVHVVPMLARPPRSAGQASYIDALMLGKPVVVTDGPGVRDHLSDGQEALIVAPDDAVSLGQAIRACLEDADLRRRLGDAGRARAQREFTLKAFRAREYDLLVSIWERHRAAT